MFPTRLQPGKKKNFRLRLKVESGPGRTDAFVGAGCNGGFLAPPLVKMPPQPTEIQPVDLEMHLASR